MTEQQTHTPGPWVPETDEIYSDVPPNASICTVLQAGPWKANARLIAAAPDMLATLRHVSYFLNLMSYTLECQETAEILKKDCEAAIAKAEGVAEGASANERTP